MAKFLILYNSSETSSEIMAKATPDEMQVSMGEWIQWRNEANKTVNVEFGLPLQNVGRVSPGGVTVSDSQVGGYATAEAASKEQLLEVLKTHPQLKRPGASIDVLEMLAMPGLNV